MLNHKTKVYRPAIPRTSRSRPCTRKQTKERYLTYVSQILPSRALVHKPECNQISKSDLFRSNSSNVG